MKFSLLINMKMPTIAGQKKIAIDSNLRYISRINFMLSRVEHEKSFITLSPGPFFQDALTLEKRPFFHATTLMIVLDTAVLILSVITQTRSLQLFLMMFTLAWLSHHIRDSVRRGLWFPPFGETQPLSKFTYLSVILLLPLVFKFVYYYWRIHPTERMLQYYDIESLSHSSK